MYGTITGGFCSHSCFSLYKQTRGCGLQTDLVFLGDDVGVPVLGQRLVVPLHGLQPLLLPPVHVPHPRQRPVTWISIPCNDMKTYCVSIINPKQTAVCFTQVSCWQCHKTGVYDNYWWPVWMWEFFYFIFIRCDRTAYCTTAPEYSMWLSMKYWYQAFAACVYRAPKWSVGTYEVDNWVSGNWCTLIGIHLSPGNSPTQTR